MGQHRKGEVVNKTAIEWADFTYNPIVGCLTNCPYCYAKRLATTRLAHLCPQCATFEPHLHPERLDQPLHVKKPALIFASSMSDWWSPGVDLSWRYSAMARMGDAGQHRFVVLTKRPDNINGTDTANWPSNAWLGVSITSGEDWWRWEALAKLPERIHKFISVEPLLGDGVAEMLALNDANGYPMPEWVIVGPQSGLAAQAVSRAWQSSIREVCNMSEPYPGSFTDIPLFEKDHTRNRLPIQPLIKQMPPDLAGVFRRGGLT
jgi:protein gp37